MADALMGGLEREAGVCSDVKKGCFDMARERVRARFAEKRVPGGFAQGSRDSRRPRTHTMPSCTHAALAVTLAVVGLGE